MLTGRRVLYTSEAKITKDNVIKVLQSVLLEHTANASDCNFLINFEKGYQPLQRIKTYRPDIDIQCIDNVANEIATFKKSFNWGNPITLIQRGSVDSNDTEKETNGIALLNECYVAEEYEKKTQELANYVEITGVGYTMIDVNTDYQDGDSWFKFYVLDPRNTFVVRSLRYTDKRVVMGVTYAENGGNKYFTVFTDDARYEITNLAKFVDKNGKKHEERWFQDKRSGESNPLGKVTIVEWIRDFDRMGCFERQIDDMNTLNILHSDFANDVDQNTQAIWHSNDVEFPKDEEGTRLTPTSGQWVQTFTAKDGKTPFITPLSITYDYGGMLNHVVTKRALILQKANVPQRNDNSGGSTGIAMSDATGWTAAETEATMQDQIKSSCKMEEIKLVLKACEKNPYIKADNPILNLRYSDIKPSIKRQKTYELTTKANFMATLLSHGFYGEHVINGANAFDDPQQVWLDSKDGITKYQNSLWDKGTTTTNNSGEGGEGENKPNADRIAQDESDQTSNSPRLS